MYALWLSNLGDGPTQLYFQLVNCLSTATFCFTLPRSYRTVEDACYHHRHRNHRNHLVWLFSLTITAEIETFIRFQHRLMSFQLV
jgi:hypothetical protein